MKLPWKMTLRMNANGRELAMGDQDLNFYQNSGLIGQSKFLLFGHLIRVHSRPFAVVFLGQALLGAGLLTAAEDAPAAKLAKHQDGAAKVADDQDELSADVQQLVIEQTVPKVIELLKEVDVIMHEATDRLAKADTGGDTIAAQTEIIEKIHAAAKEKQSQGGGASKPGGAMLEMMERMMGKNPEDGKGKGKGGQAGDQGGDQGGNGMTGPSDSGNEAIAGQPSGKSEARRVPKAAGNASPEIPEEFRKAFDAYNRGAEKKLK